MKAYDDQGRPVAAPEARLDAPRADLLEQVIRAICEALGYQFTGMDVREQRMSLDRPAITLELLQGERPGGLPAQLVGDAMRLVLEARPELMLFVRAMAAQERAHELPLDMERASTRQLGPRLERAVRDFQTTVERNWDDRARVRDQAALVAVEAMRIWLALLGVSLIPPEQPHE